MMRTYMIKSLVHHYQNTPRNVLHISTLLNGNVCQRSDCSKTSYITSVLIRRHSHCLQTKCPTQIASEHSNFSPLLSPCEWNSRMAAVTGMHYYQYNRSSKFSSESLPWRRAPLAPMKRTSLMAHGRRWVDEYAWMQNGSSEELLQYIRAENSYCDHVREEWTDSHETLKNAISQFEDVHSLSSSDLQVFGDYVYYQSISKTGSNTFCRRNIATGKDEILLDARHLAERFGYKHVVITGLKISPCQRYLGAVVESCSDVYDGHVISMDSSDDKFVECIHDIFNLEFGAQHSLLYTKPFNLHANQVWSHQIGSPIQTDILVYEEKDDRFSVDLSHTKDRCFIIINSNSRTSSELWLLDSQNLDAPPTLIWRRQEGVECYMDHCNGRLFALTNREVSAELKLICACSRGLLDEQRPTPSWQELYVPPAGAVIQDMDLFTSHCVLCVMASNKPQLVLLPHSHTPTTTPHIELPDAFTTLLPGLNTNLNSDVFEFQLSSPVQPPRDFELNLNTGQVSCHDDEEDMEAEEEDGSRRRSRQTESQIGKEYICRRLVAESKDGTQVPITIFHQQAFSLDSSHPMLVSGYGAYGRQIGLDYSPERMALVASGWVLAYCHVRGGGELGRHWYKSGRLRHKHHSFEDFESCIRLLHASGVSSPSLTAGWGASAGGLLLAVLCNRSPELLRVAVMRMPFVDVLSAMMDTTSPLTSQDLEEWGDPRSDQSLFDYISSYSPYHNITSQNYPSILVTTSLDDRRVPVWGPLKYMARLRAQTGDKTPDRKSTFIMKVYEEGGHFGANEVDGDLDQVTLEWAFLHKELGLAV